MFCSNSARFLWKNVPRVVKENRPEVGAAWKIGQRLWTRDYAGVHEAIREFNGSPEAQAFVDSFSGKLLLQCCINSNCMLYNDFLVLSVVVVKLAVLFKFFVRHL